MNVLYTRSAVAVCARVFLALLYNRNCLLSTLCLYKRIPGAELCYQPANVLECVLCPIAGIPTVTMLLVNTILERAVCLSRSKGGGRVVKEKERL